MVDSLVNIGGNTVDASTLTLPADRLFRAAWQLQGTVVTIDLPTAKQIVFDEIRNRLAPKIANLRDIIEQRSDDGLAVTNQVNRRKQLRAYLTDARVTNATDEASLRAAVVAIRNEIAAL